MRRNKLLTVIALIVLAAFAVGCRTNPVYNVANAPVPATKAKFTQTEVEKAIIKAGTQLGWRVTKEAPGKLTARLTSREVVAVVDITHNDKTYSINYKDSTNLRYDGTNIHPRYNTWIQNLDKRIMIELQSL